MPGILNWIKQNTSKLMDPDREARIQHAALHIERELATHRREFSLKAAVAGLGLYHEDIPLAARETYRSLVQRAWRDGEMSDGEKKTLKWAAGSLGLADEMARDLQRDVGIAQFQEALARAMDDGVLTAEEIANLKRLAVNLDFEPDTLMRHYFRSQCEGLLRGMFMTAVADGRIAADEWARLVATAGALGVSQRELLETIQHQAVRFVEQTLADMKMDERISPQEDALLGWLLTNIIARPEFRVYVQSEVGAVKLVAAIEGGRLPSITSRRLGLRAGEIVHSETNARFARTRQLKHGPLTDTFAGRLTLTDDRLIFDSPQLGLDVNHRRVLDIKSYTNAFELAANRKGTGYYYPEHGPEMFTGCTGSPCAKRIRPSWSRTRNRRATFHATCASACGNGTAVSVRSAARQSTWSSITSFPSRAAAATARVPAELPSRDPAAQAMDERARLLPMLLHRLFEL